jgi:archaellum component FlaC|tara:strand:- start:63 stop:314 length:252 start_codon:yes stop_codon:yes gene_type:complete
METEKLNFETIMDKIEGLYKSLDQIIDQQGNSYREFRVKLEHQLDQLAHLQDHASKDIAKIREGLDRQSEDIKHLKELEQPRS